MTKQTPTSYNAELLTIGSELLKGTVLNTNAQFLSRELRDLGFNVATHISCDDHIPAIEARLDESLSRADLIIITGGLGPTPDDITRDALAKFFKVPLIFSRQQYQRILGYYRNFGYRISEIVRREALYPKNALPLINRHGVALGFFIPWKKRLIVVLPGVPAELESMYYELVRPLLKRHFKRLHAKYGLIAKTVGISEPDVMTRLGDDFFDDPMDFGIYPEAGEVTLRLYGCSKKIINRITHKVKSRLGDSLYALHESSLAEAIGMLLTKRKKTIAVAESCTGGLLASEITLIAGSSLYFKGGIIAYSNDVKKELGVPEDLLRCKGAVSEEVAGQLAEQIRRKTRTDYGIGITGIAGPGGGNRKKPVGLVYIALASSRESIVGKFLFRGSRRQIQIKAVKKALEMLWRNLKKQKPQS